MKKLLWIDDEIELLKPYRIFLKDKGYEVESCCCGNDALQILAENRFDIIFLDENMPGMSGLETLEKITELSPDIPIVMITKNEEENLMDAAIGKRIADYLIKPVNPNQILMTLKKHLHGREIISNQTISSFREEFMKIGSSISEKLELNEWFALYKRLNEWNMKLSDNDNELYPLISSLSDEANTFFARFIQNNYIDWMKDPFNRPTTSIDLFRRDIAPLLKEDEKILMIVIDNFRYDQWIVVRELIKNDFEISENKFYLSILPSSTQYARNAIFSGLSPLDIQKNHPEYWIEEGDEETKNQYEKELLELQLKRLRIDIRVFYSKFGNSVGCEQALAEMSKTQAPLLVAVTNFVDMLSHARTDDKMIRELTKTDAAYRALTKDWFKHSGLVKMMKEMGDKGYKIIITTDHGTTRVNRALKVIGDKDTSVSLRYKVGKSLNFDKKDKKDIFEISKPSEIGLPMPNLSSTYIFATNRNFFAYPNNYNYYVSYYKDTFQHGGISMEEMIIPFICIKTKA